MESQPQNPEFRNNPENFHPCILPSSNAIDKDLSTPKRSFLPAYFETFIKKYRDTGPRRAVGNVSGNKCESGCRYRGPKFDPGPVPYFRGDRS